MGVTKDFRKEKIKELKLTIELASADLKASHDVLKEIKEEKVNTAEEKAEHLNRQKEQIKLISQKSAVLSALGEELQNTRMNKYTSSYFEWIPSPPKRRTRRLMARR